MKHVEVTASKDRGGKVVVDGEDISAAVTGVTVRVGVGSVPVVELEMFAAVSTKVDGITKVFLRPEVAEQLVAHGWTAPKDGQ